MTGLSEVQIQKACDWWGEAIQHPHFDDAGAFGVYTAPPAKIVSAFKVALRDMLACASDDLWLNVEYRPSITLLSAAETAKMSLSFVVRIVAMGFHDGGVQVLLEHRASMVDL